MKRFAWNDDKNRWLQEHRQISFEQITEAIVGGGLRDILDSRDPVRYPTQRRYVVFCEGYTYAVPCVEDAETIFLKTAYRDRRLYRRYGHKRS